MDPFSEIVNSYLSKIDAGEYPKRETCALSALLLFVPKIREKVFKTICRIELGLITRVQTGSHSPLSLSQRGKTEIYFMDNLTGIAKNPTIKIEPEKVAEIRQLLAEKKPESVEELGKLTDLSMSEVFLSLISLRVSIY